MSANAARMRSGAVVISGSCDAMLSGVQFLDNMAGALLVQNMSNVTIMNCIFADNSNDRTGGAIRLESESQISANNCIFQSNLAALNGGAIHAMVGPVIQYSNVFHICPFVGAFYK